MCMLKTLKLSAIALFVLLNLTASYAQTQTDEIINRYDIGVYHPENFGIKDLVFEMRLEGLKEELNRQKIFGELIDVYFKVFWIFPGKYKIDVHGLPTGFNEKRQILKEMIKPRLDFVLPRFMAQQIRSYTLQTKVSGNDVLIEAVDKSYTRDITNMYLTFTNKGKLKKIKTISTAGTQEIDLNLGVKSWSHNKWVLEEMVMTSYEGRQTRRVTSSVNYDLYSGFGFPKEVVVQTAYKINIPDKDNKEFTESDTKAKFIFSKYEINTGKALEEITKNKKDTKKQIKL